MITPEYTLSTNGLKESFYIAISVSDMTSLVLFNEQKRLSEKSTYDTEVNRLIFLLPLATWSTQKREWNSI